MIGRMRDRIVVKTPVDIPDEGGGAISTYQVLFKDWTEVVPFSSRRQESDGQINMVDGFKFTIRDREAIRINKTLLVEWDGLDYTINGINSIKNRHRWVEITAITTGQPVQIPVS